MKGIKIVVLSVMVLALTFAVTDCCKKCCSPSIEVGFCKEPPPHRQCGCTGFRLLTWQPITLFPRHTDLDVTGTPLQPLRPYLMKVKVTNFSNVPVRGVMAAFYWASFGLFDRGTPIGSVGVDLKANETKYVRSPWSFVLGGGTIGTSICYSVRVFHPCDTNLRNNYCFINLKILHIIWPFKYFVVPITVDFRELDGDLTFKIDTPPGIGARIVSEELNEGPVEEMPVVKALTKLTVKQGVPMTHSLVVTNEGANYKPGDTFDVTVRAFKNDSEVCSFTVQFKVK